MYMRFGYQKGYIWSREIPSKHINHIGIILIASSYPGKGTDVASTHA